jgi:hypothetical protein
MKAFNIDNIINHLDLLSQIWEKGVYLSTRTENQDVINLYMINDLLVEVFYDVHVNAVKRMSFVADFSAPTSVFDYDALCPN